MKKIVISSVLFLVIFSGYVSFGQSLALKAFTLKKMSLISRLDSLGNPVYRTDSVDVSVFMAFNHPVTDVTDIYIQYGDTTNSANVMYQPLSITTISTNYYLYGTGSYIPVMAGKNLAFKFRMKIYANFKWGTAWYKNNLSVTSVKSYYKLKN